MIVSTLAKSAKAPTRRQPDDEQLPRLQDDAGYSDAVALEVELATREAELVAERRRADAVGPDDVQAILERRAPSVRPVSEIDRDLTNVRKARRERAGNVEVARQRASETEAARI